MAKKIKKVCTTVPSSTMLFGEHAVLRSKTAIVAAVNRFLKLELIPRNDTIIQIEGAQGTIHSTTVDELQFPVTLSFIQGTFLKYKNFLRTGYTINIYSEIPQTVGLGSSAAVTAALVGALEVALFDKKTDQLLFDKKKIVQKAVDIIRLVQGGMGSGADIASVIYGGIISYKADTFDVQTLSDYIPITLIYSGYKTPTPKVIQTVSLSEKTFPDIYSSIFETIECITQSAITALIENDLHKLGLCMNMAHGCMESMQVSTKELSDIVWRARSLPNVYGAKISGSGLGDSVVVLGSMSPEEIKFGSLVDGKVSTHGIQIECIYE